MTISNEEIMADGIIEAIKTVVDPLVQRIRSLESEVGSLRERSSVKYCGVFKSGETYGLGDAATYGGSLWISKLHHNRATPGQDSGAAWQLAVKKGADGKDGRDLTTGEA